MFRGLSPIVATVFTVVFACQSTATEVGPDGGVPVATAESSLPVPGAVTDATSEPAPTIEPKAKPELGPVTKLPIPRYVSLKASESNVRRGPSLSHRIDWVFKRRNMPLQVTGEFEHWRRVRDRDGAGGWVHYSLISGVRTVIVEEDELPLLMQPSSQSPVNARAMKGVVARLGECAGDWCRITADKYRGWVPRRALWGVTADEVRD